jgi:diacylglycerol kinase family enzyme
LSSEANLRATLIVNPMASRVTEERIARVERELSAAFALATVRTERRLHARELARKVDDGTLIAFGGDGLFNEVVNGLLAPVPLGFIPGGHTNVLSRALGLPRDPVAAARRIAQGRTRRISLGRVNGRRFTFSSGIGIDSEAVRAIDAMGRAQDGRRPGDAVFARTASGLLLGGYKPRLEVRGHGRAGVLLVANDSVYTYAGRVAVRPSPRARFELGLDFVAAERVGRRELLRLLPRVALGRGLAGARGVLSGHDLDRIEVACDAPLPLQADGEDLGDVTDAVFEAERNAVAVLV